MGSYAGREDGPMSENRSNSQKILGLVMVISSPTSGIFLISYMFDTPIGIFIKIAIAILYRHGKEVG